MPLDRISDHASKATTRLPSYQQSATNYVRLFNALSSEVQAIEDVLQDLLTLRAISTANGQQLDNLGTILDLERESGQSDSSYRSALQGRAGDLAGSGTPDQLISAYKALTSANSVEYWEIYPATAQLHADGTDSITDADVLSAMARVKMAGVQLILMIAPEPVFHWGDSASADGAGDLPTAVDGFGDSADANASGDLDPGEGGGNLSRVL